MLRAGPLPSDQAILRRTEGKWNNLDELIAHLSRKTCPAFLFSAGEKEKYVTTLRKRFSANVEETLRKATSICQHQFNFLGLDLTFNNDINWHLDPESGRSWPRIYYEKMGDWTWSVKRIGDFKITWELNRHQYFVTLGKAYWLTGDERYADECASQILSWIRDNPRGMGINWYSALEIGVRLIAWAWTFHFLRSSPSFIARAGKPFLKSIYQQAAFLRANLTLNVAVRNNHIIGEAAGLVLVGSLFPEFKEAGEWLNTGLQIFEQELILQTFSDGANKEQATSYHRFVLDFLILMIALARRGAIPTSRQLEKLSEQMLDYIMYTTMPNGDSPMIGDADEGRGYILNECANFWDFRDWLAVGTVLYERPDFKFLAQNFGEEAFWLLGPDGLRCFEQLECVVPKETSFSFPEAGHYVIRDSWTPDCDFALFKCGPFGWGGDGFCAHSHCDLLAFVLSVKGMPILVDPGTYTYHGTWRDQFRLTSAHNTLMVDGYEQARPLAYFGWQNVPQAECLAWDGRRVVGSMLAAPGLEHRREIFHPESGVWEVTDTLKGEGLHKVSWSFHFATALTLRWVDTSENVIVEEHGKPYVAAFPPQGVRVEIGRSWVSSSYGKKELSPILHAIWEGETLSNSISFCWKFLSIKQTSVLSQKSAIEFATHSA